MLDRIFYAAPTWLQWVMLVCRAAAVLSGIALTIMDYLG